MLISSALNADNDLRRMLPRPKSIRITLQDTSLRTRSGAIRTKFVSASGKLNVRGALSSLSVNS
jgi:hypothetical protein